jgi:hypothetical protein
MFTVCKYNCHSFALYLLYASLHHILMDICKYPMMQSSLWSMVRTRTSNDPILNIHEGSAGHGHGQAPCGNAPPPPPHPPLSLEQLLATQNDLMRRLVKNDEHRGAKRLQPRHQDRDSSYSDFLETRPPVFSYATDPLEADRWLWMTESNLASSTVQSSRRLCTQHNNSELS